MNIYGIGIDIVEVQRIKKAIDKNKNFLTRVFNEEEIKMFEEKKYNILTIAGNFAAKEAFSKAIGTGIRNFNFNDIIVLRNELGKPYIKINKNLKNICNDFRVQNIMVSISHSKNYAVANCIVLN